MDHVRSNRARFQVTGFGSRGIVLDTQSIPEQAIKYSGTFEAATHLAEGLNLGHQALMQERLHTFEEAYSNAMKKGDDR